MKKILTLLILSCSILISCNQDQGIGLKVLSLNIRYDNPADAPNDWPSRKDFVLSFLEEESPDIFGLQEALWHQHHYLDSLMEDYRSIAVGRDDGGRKGEMTPVFFRKDRFCTLSYGTFWLSETPGIIGSRGWGAVLPRIVTWVELEDRQSGGRFFFFNTHYSHMSDSARVMSSRIIVQHIKDLAGETPFVLTGDFNMLPGSEAYATLTEGGREGALIIDSYVLNETEPSGPGYTFNGFRDEEREGRIDYIFVSKGIRVLSYEVMAPKKEGLFISDHWPVAAGVNLPIIQ